jgi:hypothetical protein
MDYVLFAVLGVAMLSGLVKLYRNPRAAHGTVWRVVLLWALLVGAGLAVWFASARFR